MLFFRGKQSPNLINPRPAGFLPRGTFFDGLKIKRSFASSLLLIGLSTLLSACQSPESDNGLVHLRFSTWGSAQEVHVLQTLIHAFEAQNPTVRVELMHIPDNYYQKLHILIAGDLAPDVMAINSFSFPIYASQQVFRDLSADLKTDADIHAADFYQPALKGFLWKTGDHAPQLGALPRDVSDVVIFYNKTLFKKSNVPEPTADWTSAQFLSTAKTLTKDTNGDGDPDVFGVSFYTKPPLFWLPFVWSDGGSLLSEDGKMLTLDSPQSLTGLQAYADLRNRWHVAPRQAESGGANMSQLFLQQKIAMLVSGRWSVPVLREQATFDWDVAPFPRGTSGQSRVGIDASGYAIAAHSAHPRESWALLKFLVSKKAITAFSQSGLIVPARPDVAQNDAFLEPAAKPQHSRVFLNAITHGGVPTQAVPRWNELSESLQLALEPVWNGQVSAKDALHPTKPALQRLLEDAP